MDGPRILTFLDSVYPGWRVKVDDFHAPMLTACGNFKAVELSPGTHEVVFQFVPMADYLGLGVCATTLLLAGIVSCRLSRYGRSRLDQES